MRVALARHDLLVRDAIEHWGWPRLLGMAFIPTAGALQSGRCPLMPARSHDTDAPIWRYHRGATAQMICTHVLARSAYSQSARDRCSYVLSRCSGGAGRPVMGHSV